MITKIVLRNFQKWKKLVVEFDEVTVLRGRSDVGKSSVIRALRWVVFNLPKGTSFIRNGASKCSVTLHVDGHVIKRIRSKEDNVYMLDGEVFRSFKNDVPEPIQKILRIGQDSFQQQHDGVYWLSLSPSDVSKRLNEIADLQSMDQAVREGVRNKREASSRLKFLKEQKQSAKEKLTELAIVPEMAAAFRAVEQQAEILRETQQKQARLIKLLDTRNNLAEKHETALTAVVEFRTICELEQSGLKHQKRYESLYQVQKEIHSLQERLQRCKSQQQRIQKELKEEISKKGSTCPTCGGPMGPRS